MEERKRERDTERERERDHESERYIETVRLDDHTSGLEGDIRSYDLGVLI